jgi:hypothetical protein
MPGGLYQRNRIRKHNGALVRLCYYDQGTTELLIVSGNNEFKKVLSSEVLPYSPLIELFDITGDQNRELFVFYPCTDFWDATCYRLEIYDISDFY